MPPPGHSTPLTASSPAGATTCTDDVKVTEPTPSIPCDVIAGDLIVSDKVAGSVSIEGPKKITGNFDVTNATKIVGISSTSVKEVNGKFILNGCTLLSTADFQALQSIASINLVNLPQLQTLNFGTSGVTKVSNVLIVDTFMGNLDGFNVADADTIDISNNPKLNTFTSDLVTVTKSLKIVDNGKDMVIEMSKLESAGEIEFRRIKKATFDSLKNASSIKINDSPDLLTVSALNVTTIDASVSLINNKKLSNCSFPQVKTIKGDMTILNNTALVSMDCFPKLESVGNILVGGSMQKCVGPEHSEIRWLILICDIASRLANSPTSRAVLLSRRRPTSRTFAISSISSSQTAKFAARSPARVTTRTRTLVTALVETPRAATRPRRTLLVSSASTRQCWAWLALPASPSCCKGYPERRKSICRNRRRSLFFTYVCRFFTSRWWCVVPVVSQQAGALAATKARVRGYKC